MKKRIAILALLLFLPALVWGDTLTYIQGVTGVVAEESGTPATYTVDSSGTVGFDIADGGVNGLVGQTFTVAEGEAGKLTELILYIEDVDTSGTLVCRIGTADDQLNMGSDYRYGSIALTSGTYDDEVTITITDGPTMAVGENFAICCQAEDGLAVGVGYAYNSNPYAGGTMYWTRSALDWDLTGHQSASNDLHLKYTVLQ